MREQLISDLQARIEEDFERWQTAVNTAVENRKRDGDRFQVVVVVFSGGPCGVRCDGAPS